MSADTETLKIAETDTETDISAEISADTDTETDNFRSLIIILISAHNLQDFEQLARSS